MRELSPFDARQLSRMCQTVADYRAGSIQIGTVISNFDGLLKAMEDVSPEWKDSVQAEINVLDLVWAAALDQKRKQWSEQDRDLIEKTLTLLERLLEEVR